MDTRRSLGLATLAVTGSYAGWKLLPWFAPDLMPQPTWSGSPVPYVPRNMAPRQRDVVKLRGWTLHPLADIAQRGRVLGLTRYRLDSLAGIAPYDVAMGWGPMSDPAMLRRLTLWQDDRFYLTRWSDPSLPWNSLYPAIKNIHSIPANDEVWSKISRLRANQVILLEGTLVDARADSGGGRLLSSIRYDDTGAGSCQACLVRNVTVDAT